MRTKMPKNLLHAVTHQSENPAFESDDDEENTRSNKYYKWMGCQYTEGSEILDFDCDDCMMDVPNGKDTCSVCDDMMEGRFIIEDIINAADDHFLVEYQLHQLGV